MNVLSILNGNDSRVKKFLNIGLPILCFGLLVFSIVDPAFAKDSSDIIVEVLDKMLTYIGIIFVAIGIVLTAYSIGQLLMAFKNEDADSKSRASTLLIVGVLLIAMPFIINSFDLTQYIETALEDLE